MFDLSISLVIIRNVDSFCFLSSWIAILTVINIGGNYTELKFPRRIFNGTTRISMVPLKN